jgi:hypothetical protein
MSVQLLKVFLVFAGVSNPQQTRSNYLWPSRISNNKGTTGARTWWNKLGKGLLHVLFVCLLLYLFILQKLTISTFNQLLFTLTGYGGKETIYY